MQSHSHWIVRLLYNNNPFYLISGLIVLFALHSNSPTLNVSDPGNSGGGIWGQSLLMAGWMAAYSIAMAVTAICVVRVAKIWEDARTIYLIVVLSTLGMSVVFDQLSIQSHGSAAVLLICGLVFSIVLVEMTLRISKLKLPVGFRIPTYLLYVTFFATPIFLSSNSSWIQQLGDLKVVVFPMLASLVFLLLLPAVRRGSQYVENNGSPWIWPYYPWSLIVILFVGVLFRSSALAVSFGPMEESSLFINPFFLMPLAMVVLVLLMEIAIVENLPSLRKGVFAFSPVLLLPGFFGSVMPFQESLVADIGATIAEPILISGWCLVLVYLQFFQRGVLGSRFAISLAMAILSIPTAESALFQGSASPLILLGLLPILVELTAAITKRNSQPEWVSSGLFCGFWIGIVASYQLNPEISFLIGCIAALTWSMTIGLIFDSALMAIVRQCCAVALGATTTILTWVACVEGQIPWSACLAAWLILGASVFYFMKTRRLGWKRVSQYNGLVAIIIQLNLFRDSIMPLLDTQQSLAIGGSVLFFVIGVVITSIKAGALNRIRENWNRPRPTLIPGF